MTDRELLELAAKAAGIEIKPHVNGRLFKELMFTYGGKNWNPLTDDGDALRLAVKLRLSVYHRPSGGSLVLDHAGKNAADDMDTRRAIVRAAAEIGRSWND